MDLTIKYKSAGRKLLLLDYDGTLVEFNPVPEKAIPTENLSNILLKLINQSQTKVIVISGRGCQDIDKLLGHLPIDIIAEHGAFIKERGKWKNQVIDDSVWKKETLSVLNQIVLTCPQSFIEEKNVSLTWHYRNSETNLGYAQSRELIYLLKDIVRSYNLKILDGNKIIEILPRNIGKGKAVKKIIEQGKYDSVLSIGDDKTDEEMFDFLLNNDNAITIKVGNGSTHAKYKLDDVSSVISLLEQLSQCD